MIHWTRPKIRWDHDMHIVSLIVHVADTGEFTATVAVMVPGGPKLRHYRLPGGSVDGLVAPRQLEATLQAAESMIAEWVADRLR